MNTSPRPSAGRPAGEPSVCTVFDDDGNLVLALSGEFDGGNTSVLTDFLHTGARRSGSCLVVDMRAVDFVDSAAVRVIEQTAHRLAEEGRTLVLRCPSRQLRLILELSRESTIVPKPRMSDRTAIQGSLN